MDNLRTVTIATKDPTRTKIITIITDDITMTMGNGIVKIGTIKKISLETASSIITVTGRETTTQAMGIITATTTAISREDKIPNTNIIGSEDNDYLKINYVCSDLHL